MLLFQVAEAFAEDVQIVAEAGVEVAVDGQARGTTSDGQGGLYLSDVSAGYHTLTAKKAGYAERGMGILVEAGRTLTVELRFETLPEVLRPLEDRQALTLTPAVGSVELRSAPANPPVEVWIDGHQRGAGQFAIDNLPAGDHAIEFRRGTEVISGKFAVEDGRILRVRADFQHDRISSEVVDFPAPTPPSGPTGEIRVVGDVAALVIKGKAGSFGSGRVPAGSYEVVATMNGGATVPVGTIAVAAGETVTVTCNSALRLCRTGDK